MHHRVNLAYEYTPGHIENKIKLQINRAPVPQLGIPAYSLCFALENKYPDFSHEFMDYDKNNDMKVTGKAMVQYGRASSCAEGDGEIKLNFEHSTTREAREQLKNKWYYKQCQAMAQTPAWRGRSSLPVSEPCFMTVYDATNARKYTWDIQFTKVQRHVRRCGNQLLALIFFSFFKVSDRLQRIASRIKGLVEAGLLPYWDADPEDNDDGAIGPFLNLDVTFKEDESLMDIKTETRRGIKEYKDVALRLDWTKKMRNLKFDDGMRKLFYARIISKGGRGGRDRCNDCNKPLSS